MIVCSGDVSSTWRHSIMGHTAKEEEEIELDLSYCCRSVGEIK